MSAAPANVPASPESLYCRTTASAAGVYVASADSPAPPESHLCRSFMSSGGCALGADCPFPHADSPARARAEAAKKGTSAVCRAFPSCADPACPRLHVAIKPRPRAAELCADEVRRAADGAGGRCPPTCPYLHATSGAQFAAEYALKRTAFICKSFPQCHDAACKMLHVPIRDGDDPVVAPTSASAAPASAAPVCESPASEAPTGVAPTGVTPASEAPASEAPSGAPGEPKKRGRARAPKARAEPPIPVPPVPSPDDAPAEAPAPNDPNESEEPAAQWTRLPYTAGAPGETFEYVGLPGPDGRAPGRGGRDGGRGGRDGRGRRNSRGEGRRDDRGAPRRGSTYDEIDALKMNFRRLLDLARGAQVVAEMNRDPAATIRAQVARHAATEFTQRIRTLASEIEERVKLVAHS